jgi:Cu-Zn family superoxide dismutase
MKHGSVRTADPITAAAFVTLLGTIGACSANDDPPASSESGAAAATERPQRLAVAEPPAATVPAPAADAPVQAPVSSAPNPTPVATLAAKAEVQPTAGHEARGTVEFYLAQPSMAIKVELAGLKPGNHGFHVHENGDCGGANAAAAGAHLNPNGTPHGDPDDADQRHHAGDLGNVRAEDDGTVKQWLRTEDMQLQGPAGILGKAIVVHSGDDDLKSDPAGESGEPIACGVIKAVAW